MSNNNEKWLGSTAFIFPGQGSQSLGMLSAYSDTVEVKQTFEQASNALGYDLWALSQHGPEQALNQTNKTQPLLLTASVALWRAWQSRAPIPALLAGHSLGEYSALVCAGILDFEDGVKLVEQRGLYMQQAVPEGIGKMAAIIGLDDDKVRAACEISADSEIVAPVNYNSPGQIVIAGNIDAVERAMGACKAAGAKRALPLAVSVPSHCKLMKPASDKLKGLLDTIKISDSKIKVVNNVDVLIETESDQIKDALVRQLYCPVRWSECINYLIKNDIRNLVECGPGKVLSGLTRRIDRSLTSYQTSEPDSLNVAAEKLSETQA